MWEYLIAILLAIILGSVFYFVRMCNSFDCKDENGVLSLPWKGLIEPILKPSQNILFSSYNAFIFIIPLIILSEIITLILKNRKKKKKHE